MIPTLALAPGSDLAGRLNALPGALSQTLLTAALKASAEPMRDRMAEQAPRAEHEINRPARAPGHLADHIVISATRKVDGETLGEGQAAVAIGPAGAYWWGIFSELGTRHESARPFVRPAYDTTQDQCLTRFTAELWTRLRALTERGFGELFTPNEHSGGLL